MPSEPRPTARILPGAQSAVNTLPTGSRPQLPPNRPTTRPTPHNHHNNNSNNKVAGLSASLGKMLANPSGGPRTGLVRAPPPPSDPAPPNQPMVHPFTNNQRMDNRANDNRLSAGIVTGIDDPNQRLAAALQMHSNRNHQHPRTQPPRPPPAASLPRVKALYDYSPQDLDELALKEGDVIEVLKERELLSIEYL